MRELVVCSGKGGTGKTSVVASFAALADNCVLADCDVDAADLHLILSPRLERREEFSGGKQAEIDADQCIGCGVCQAFCRFSAITENYNPDGSVSFAVDPLACEGCGVCVHFCPEHAVEFPDAVSGEWYLSETRHGPLVHARLGIAAENSGKLVSLVRKQAKSLAVKTAKNLVIVDGPPGIGCPVIASITGADRVLIVTEPSKTGLHDLRRVHDLARFFDIPVSVCVNKHDINDAVCDEIISYCEENGLPVAGKIPYDPLVTGAQLEATSVVERNSSPAAQAIKDTWKNVEQSMR